MTQSASKRILWAFVAFFMVVLIGLVFWVGQYVFMSKTELEAKLTQVFHQPVTIESAQLTWHHLQPNLHIKNLTMSDKQGQANRVESLSLQLNWWRSLLNKEWLLNQLTMHNAKFYLSAAMLSQDQKHTSNVSRLQLIQKLRDRWLLRLYGTHIAIDNVGFYFAQANAKPILWQLKSLRSVVDKKTDTLQADITGPNAAVVHLGLDLGGSWSQPWDLHYDVEVQQLSLADIPYRSRIIIKGARMSAADFSVDLTGHWGHQASSANGEFSIKNIVWEHDSVAHSAAVDLSRLHNVAAKLDWFAEGKKAVFEFKNLSMLLNKTQRVLKHIRFSCLLSTEAYRLKKIVLSATSLQSVESQLRQLGVFTRQLDQIKAYNIQATLHDMTVNFDEEGAFKNIRVQIDQLHSQAINAIPGIQSLGGDLVFNQQQLYFDLTGLNTQLDFAHAMFNTPLRANVAIAGYFVKNDASWELQFSHFDFDDGNLLLKTSGQLKKDEGKPLRADIAGHFSLAQLAKIQHYLPKAKMSAALYRWLSSSLQFGSLQQGHLRIQGQMDQFPFTHAPGIFTVGGTLNNTTLKFAKTWSPLKNMYADLEFTGDSMHLLANTASIDGSAISIIDAHIPDLSKAVLAVTTKASGDMTNALQLLHHSPLRVGQRLQVLRSHGPYTLNLGLNINLHKDYQTTLNGDLFFNHDTLSLPKWLLTLQQLQGHLLFDENSLHSQDVTASWYGSPMALQVHTQAHAHQRPDTVFGLSGTLSSLSIDKFLGYKIDDFISGVAQCHAHLVIPDAKGSHTILQFQTDLKGMAIHAVSPLSKTAAEIAPLVVSLDIPGDSFALLHMSYNQAVYAESSWQPGDGFSKGILSFGKITSHTLPTKGLLVRGELSTLDIKQWRGFIDRLKADFMQGSSSAAAVVAPAWLNQIDIVADRCYILHHLFKDIHFIVLPKKTSLLLNVMSAAVLGSVNIPINPHEPWLLNFKRAHFPDISLKQSKSSADSFDWAQLPPIHADLHQLTVGKKYFSHVLMDSTPQKDAVQLATLNLTTADYALESHGVISLGSTKKAQLAGHFSARDLGSFLSDKGFAGIIYGGSLSANFSLQWPGSLLGFSLKHSAGEIKLNMTNGFLSISKTMKKDITLMRFLNLLSVQALPSHVLSGFMDIAHKGLKFNAINSDLSLSAGKLRLQHTSLDGPNVKVDALGSINMLNKTLNITIGVYPQVTSSLPLIAAIAGGPIVGIASWLINKIFIEPQVGKAMARFYDITGPWGKLAFTKVVSMPKTPFYLKHRGRNHD